MDDLETQLRRYGDQVEGAVDAVLTPTDGTAAPSTAPTSSRRSPLFLAAAVVAVALIGAAALFLGGDDTTAGPTAEAEAASDDRAADSSPVDEVVVIDTPDTIGLDIDGARQLLLAAGLMFEVEFEPSADVPVDQVLAQVPPPGQAVEPGSLVALRVSSGPEATVPNVIGLLYEEAMPILAELGYQVTAAMTTTPGPGVVVAQVPPPGTVLAPGETVELSVSGSSPTIVPVPDVTGLDVADAIGAIRAAGLEIDPTQVEEASDEIGTGRVVRTIPEANTLLASGSTIAMVTSTGVRILEVPMVLDLFADTAITTLRSQGLEVVTLFETVPVGSPSVGRVIRQSPDAFAEVSGGSIVTITVGESFPQTTTTTTP